MTIEDLIVIVSDNAGARMFVEPLDFRTFHTLLVIITCLSPLSTLLYKTLIFPSHVIALQSDTYSTVVLCCAYVLVTPSSELPLEVTLPHEKLATSLLVTFLPVLSA